VVVLSLGKGQRDTNMNEKPLYIFSDEFKNNQDKQKQWQAFVRKNNLATKDDFERTVEKVQTLLEPIYLQINSVQSENRIWNVETWCWE